MSVTEFNPIKALKEEIQGLGDVRKKMAEAEAEHGAVTKLLGFADAELARKREVLRQLEEQANV